MGMTSSEMPPPDASSSKAVGQQTAPSTIVPHTPGLVPGAGQAQTNNLALVSLITGILSFLGHVVPVIGGAALAIVAIITGYIARNQIKQSGEPGMGMATIGMVLGIANLAFTAVITFIVLFFIFVLGIGLLGYAATHN